MHRMKHLFVSQVHRRDWTTPHVEHHSPTTLFVQFIDTAESEQISRILMLCMPHPLRFEKLYGSFHYFLSKHLSFLIKLLQSDSIMKCFLRPQNEKADMAWPRIQSMPIIQAQIEKTFSPSFPPPPPPATVSHQYISVPHQYIHTLCVYPWKRFHIFYLCSRFSASKGNAAHNNNVRNHRQAIIRISYETMHTNQKTLKEQLVVSDVSNVINQCSKIIDSKRLASKTFLQCRKKHSNAKICIKFQKKTLISKEILNYHQ